MYGNVGGRGSEINAYVRVDGTGGVTIIKSKNVSSVTDLAATGAYTVNFATALPSADYCVTCLEFGANRVAFQDTATTAQTALVCPIFLNTSTTNAGRDADFSMIMVGA